MLIKISCKKWIEIEMGDEPMLKTPEERTELLKAGYNSKKIEELYIRHNNFKIIRTPVLYESVEFDKPRKINEKLKLEFMLIFVLVSLIIAICVPILEISFALILGFLFVPPILTMGLIIFKATSVIFA